MRACSTWAPPPATSYLVGIAYEEQYNHPSYGNTDWVFLLDEAGNLYSTGFLPYGGSYSRFGVSSMGNLGYTCDTEVLPVPVL